MSFHLSVDSCKLSSAVHNEHFNHIIDRVSICAILHPGTCSSGFKRINASKEYRARMFFKGEKRMGVYGCFLFLPQSNKEMVMIQALVSIHSWREAKIDTFIQPLIVLEFNSTVFI